MPAAAARPGGARTLPAARRYRNGMILSTAHPRGTMATDCRGSHMPANNVRAARERAGESLRAAAKAIGLSFSTLQGIETGTGDVMLTTARRIASHFGTTVDALWPPKKGKA